MRSQIGQKLDVAEGEPELSEEDAEELRLTYSSPAHADDDDPEELFGAPADADEAAEALPTASAGARARSGLPVVPSSCSSVRSASCPGSPAASRTANPARGAEPGACRGGPLPLPLPFPCLRQAQTRTQTKGGGLGFGFLANQA